MAAEKKDRTFKLTRRSKRLAEILVLGAPHSMEQAKVMAGYSETTPVVRILKRPQIQEYVMQLLKSKGISEEHLAGKMGELLECTKPFVSGKEEGVPIVELVPDNTVQARVLELAAEVIGWKTPPTTNIGIGINLGDKNEVAELMHKADEMLTRYKAATKLPGP